MRGYLLDGLQQARDTILPAVRCARLFKPFVEDELPAMIGNGAALVAHPGVAAPCPVALNRDCTLAIGPEGGFTAYEVEKLQQAGLQPVQMGERILQAARLTVEAVSLLPSMRQNSARLNSITEKIIHLEEDSDNLNDGGIKALFRRHRDGNAMTYIVGIEIYDHLEKVMDRFEDVANRISGIVIEQL